MLCVEVTVAQCVHAVSLGKQRQHHLQPNHREDPDQQTQRQMPCKRSLVWFGLSSASEHFSPDLADLRPVAIHVGSRGSYGELYLVQFFGIVWSSSPSDSIALSSRRQRVVFASHADRRNLIGKFHSRRESGIETKSMHGNLFWVYTRLPFQMLRFERTRREHANALDERNVVVGGDVIVVLVVPHPHDVHHPTRRGTLVQVVSANHQLPIRSAGVT